MVCSGWDKTVFCSCMRWNTAHTAGVLEQEEAMEVRRLIYKAVDSLGWIWLRHIWLTNLWMPLLKKGHYSWCCNQHSNVMLGNVCSYTIKGKMFMIRLSTCVKKKDNYNSTWNKQWNCWLNEAKTIHHFDFYSSVTKASCIIKQAQNHLIYN